MVTPLQAGALAAERAAARDGKEAPMTFRGKPRDPSRSMLDQVQADLNRSIEELCDVSNVADESTGEMERLSDRLLDAARRAHIAAELRKSMRRRPTNCSHRCASPGLMIRRPTRSPVS